MLYAFTIYGALTFALGTVCGALGVAIFSDRFTRPARHV